MFVGYETDKDSHHNYGPFYTGLLADRKMDVKTILELGIDRGGSLKAFRDFFPNAVVVGFDINPATMVHGEKRIRTYCGNVRDKRWLRELATVEYDFIVDDASHIPIDIFHALKGLWPALRRGGYYFVEDLDISRQADVITTCYIVTGQSAEIHIHPGRRRNGDILVLEKHE
jgi:hypothetical protein